MKRNRDADGSGRGGQRTLAGGQVRTSGSTLRMLIRMAYRLSLTDEIVGGPSWIDSYGFDVDARPARPVTIAESALMMRTLLADRFQLQVRKEPRDMPVYALMLAQRDGTLGPQIQKAAGECVMIAPPAAVAPGANAGPIDPARLAARPSPGQPGRRCGIGPDDGVTRGGSVTMGTLVTFLTPLMDRPVVDRTGLPGVFDFDLRYDGATIPGTGRLGGGRGPALGAAADPAAASIFTALQEQLGLRLDPQRGPVDVLAVVRAELPTEN